MTSFLEFDVRIVASIDARLPVPLTFETALSSSIDARPMGPCEAAFLIVQSALLRCFGRRRSATAMLCATRLSNACRGGPTLSEHRTSR